MVPYFDKGESVNANGDQPTPKATAWHARADYEGFSIYILMRNCVL